MYSLSTCWNSHRHTDGRAMLHEIRELGFDFAELSHGIRISLLPGIYDAVDAGEIKISTLHNFCPLPIGINHPAPNLYQFTADSPRERENALRHSLKTIETAARVKAQLVVLHLGSVDLKGYTEKLEDLVASNQRHTSKYEKVCRQLVDKREALKGPAMERMSEVLHRLAAEATKLGIKLGIENREAVEEVPFEVDFELFLREMNDPVIGYWHDTGHAQIKENLGFIGHVMHLESLAPRLFGFHIHDVEFPGKDHRPPGTGMIDFAALQPFVKTEHIKVFEMSPGIKPDDVRRGVAHLKSLWGDA